MGPPGTARWVPILGLMGTPGAASPNRTTEAPPQTFSLGWWVITEEPKAWQRWPGTPAPIGKGQQPQCPAPALHPRSPRLLFGRLFYWKRRLQTAAWGGECQPGRGPFGWEGWAALAVAVGAGSGLPAATLGQALGTEALRCVSGEPATCERADAHSSLSMGKQPSEDRREPEAKGGTSGKAPSPLWGSEVGRTTEWSQMQIPGEASPRVLPSTIG